MKVWHLLLIITLIFVLIVVVLVATEGATYAHRLYHHHGHFGVIIGPRIWIGPPAIRYYDIPYDYYRPFYRIWVPGYWDWRWDSYYGCWRKIWIPGYWR